MCLVTGDLYRTALKARRLSKFSIKKEVVADFSNFGPAVSATCGDSRTSGSLAILPTITIQLAANARLYKMLSEVVAHR